MPHRATLSSLRLALGRQLPGPAAQERMSPPGRPTTAPAGSGPAREAAVLVLVYPKAGLLHFALTLRASRLGHHSGQVSFPGGGREPDDRDLVATALRETREELGLDVSDADILGQLTPLYVPPSHFLMQPIVAYRAAPPAFDPNPAEVAEVIEVGLEALLADQNKGATERALASLGGRQVVTPYYALAGHIVWGATAMVLSELEELLRSIDFG